MGSSLHHKLTFRHCTVELVNGNLGLLWGSKLHGGFTFRSSGPVVLCVQCVGKYRAATSSVPDSISSIKLTEMIKGKAEHKLCSYSLSSLRQKMGEALRLDTKSAGACDVATATLLRTTVAAKQSFIWLDARSSRFSFAHVGKG